MKKILICLAALVALAGCQKWTETESAFEPKEVPIGGGFDDEYYANLRLFKATMKYRKISWAWYGGWSAVGSYNYGTMAGLPDSLDVVSLWGGWDYSGNTPNVIEAKKKDMEYVQKVKGMRIVATDLIGNFDTARINSFGWVGDLDPKGASVSVGQHSMYSALCTPEQESAIRKYARWVGERVLALGYDGYDIDYEIGWGSRGTLVEYQDRMRIYVDEISKMMGPKSGTDKLFVIDGAICNLPTPEMARCFDWLVIQSYRCGSYTDLNTGGNRCSQAVNRIKTCGMSVDSIVRMLVMTEDYEGGRGGQGGVPHASEFHGSVNSLLGMALWQPVYNGVRYERSGGCGAYHVEYEYAAKRTDGKFPGWYPWMREAIQAMNPANVKNK
ncbi:MAG: glycoside hydrolase family 18 [Rikenellaceae bacterium]|jgi:hypothetical protein|nr:glycoside hydrolase family 18 [Rikenellaceae bacterium]